MTGTFDIDSLDATSDSYYRPLGDGRFMPTLHAQGAWQEHEQHMAPVAGLLTHCLEQAAENDLQIARITFDILGMIPAQESTVECRTLRPGRTIQLDEAVMSVGGRPVVRATAWRLAQVDTEEVAGHEIEPMVDPESLPRWDSLQRWGGGYIASLDFRVDSMEPGRARAWVRPTKHLVEGGGASEQAEFLGVVDASNGIATRVEPEGWMFPNTDLTIHLHRRPRGAWVGLDTSVAFGPTGLGLTSSVLHDRSGPVGRSEQILTVRPMPTA